MRNLILALALGALAAQAVPAPQALDGIIAPTIEGPEGICSSTGEYWDGYKYVTCGELRFCRNNGCDWETPPVAEGVTSAVTAAITQGTAVAGGNDAPNASGQNSGSEVVSSTGASESAVASAMDIDVALQANSDSASAIASGTTAGVSTASGSTTAQATSGAETQGQSLTDVACVDDRPNEHVNLTKSPDDKWELKGPKCEPRTGVSTQPRFVAYWNQWSDGALLPTAEQLKGVTHLVLSFAGSDISQTGSIEWTPQSASAPNPFNQTDFVGTLKKIEGVDPDMKVLAAFGGWNLDAGFSKAANSGDMAPLAEQIVKFKSDNNLDGIDIDWEYPVGGGGFYKACAATTDDHKLPERPNERGAFVDLLRHIRAADPDGHLTVAVPSKKVDRELSFPKATIEDMDLCLDEWSLMTYDMMNRRDDKTLHHAGSAVIKDVLDYYHSNGVTDKKKFNIGFANYAKYFTLSNSTSEDCTSKGGLGCEIFPAEGPAGQDLGTSGTWTFNQDQNPLDSPNVATDFTLKLAKKSWDSMPTDESVTHDGDAGASSWADVNNRMFWTWTTPKDIEQSCADHMKDAGGVMVWSINQDMNGASGGPHMAAIANCVGMVSSEDEGSGDSSITDGTVASSASASGSSATVAATTEAVTTASA